MKKTNKKILALLVSVFLSTLLFGANEKWTSGAFEEEGSQNVSTSTKTINLPDGLCEYSYSFASEKSNSAYIQAELKTKKSMPFLKLTMKGGTKKYNIQIWLEDKNGWKFQKDIELFSKNWKSFIIKIKELKSEDVINVRLVFRNRVNPEKGLIFIKFPQFATDMQ